MSWNDHRPMSPHLQVYDLPLTAKMSILHRATGAALFIGLVFMVWILAVVASGGNANANGAESWGEMQAFLSHGFIQFILFLFTLSLYYHLCNGIRHLFWDMGKGLDPESTSISGKTVIIVSLLLTLSTWMVAFMWGGP